MQKVVCFHNAFCSLDIIVVPTHIHISQNSKDLHNHWEDNRHVLSIHFVVDTDVSVNLYKIHKLVQNKNNFKIIYTFLNFFEIFQQIDNFFKAIHVLHVYCIFHLSPNFVIIMTFQNNDKCFFQITKLKIDSNPFAKGFRDSTRLTEFER